MSNQPAKPPRTYSSFVRHFPKLGEAWDMMRKAEEAGPYDEQTLRLLKLAVAVGAGREGAVHSCVRKARAAGCTPEAIRHVVALAASTIGLPSAVAVYSWIEDLIEE
ncbi:MAG TPA: carboxymuconolactone decarboxylase family protein [Candidatus Limnocylindrales bacterium]|nr:carboxymuconolactone decarboxylase family protein [Candidatus Limnocylindrales bacterium]